MWYLFHNLVPLALSGEDKEQEAELTGIGFPKDALVTTELAIERMPLPNDKRWVLLPQLHALGAINSLAVSLLHVEHI
jgi:hypothetical protein